VSDTAADIKYPDMTDAPADRLRPVRIWLWAVALLVALMVIVGGATRLTESGLSITEWRPVTGALPPLSLEAWQAEFDRYRQIPQYQLINKGMSLAEFQYIYYWEWGHRVLGRIIGFAFAIPLVFFWLTGRVRGTLLAKLLGLLVLGGLQGVVGWWMVASGLVDRVSVAPYRLATHLTLAFIIFALLIALARSLEPARPRIAATGRLRLSARALVGVIFLQLFLGAIVAGLDAGMTFTTWPLMDGMFIPDAARLTIIEPVWRNLFENPMTAQFAHRMTAYALLIFAAVHAFSLRRADRWLYRSAHVLFGLVFLQAVIGILTLIYVVPIDIALAHQFGALVVLGWAVSHAGTFAGQPAGAGRAALRPVSSGV
jgi:heme a synthase